MESFFGYCFLELQSYKHILNFEIEKERKDFKLIKMCKTFFLQWKWLPLYSQMGKLQYYLWMALERFGANGISFLSNICLSYFVMPKEYGVVASLAIFTNIIFVLLDCGMSDGIMRYKNATDKDFNTLFWFNTFMGVMLCVAYNILAPFVADYLGIPETEGVMRLMGFGAILSAMTISQATKQRYTLNFKKMSLINLATVASMATTCIIMGWLGCGYWAVAMLTFGFSFYMLLYLFIFTKWNIKFEFSIETFKDLWRFGVNLLFTVLTTQVAQNLYSFMLGKFSPTQSSFFVQGQKLENAPMRSMESTITYTSFVMIAKETEEEKRRSELVKVYGMIAVIMFCFMGVAFVLSEPLIALIFPVKWLPVVPYFRLLVVLGFFQAMSRFQQNFYKIYNRTRTLAKLVLCENMLLIVSCLILFFLKVDIFEIIYLTICVTMIMNLVSLYIGSRIALIRYREFVKLLVRAMIVGISAIVPTYFLVEYIDQNIIAVFLGLLLYAVLVIGMGLLLMRNYFTMMLNKIIKRKI